MKAQVEALQNSQVAGQESGARMLFITTRLQTLLNEARHVEGAISTNPPKDQTTTLACGNSIDYDGYGQFIYSSSHPTIPSHASTYSEDDSGDELPVDSGGSLSYANDPRNDDGLLLDEGLGYFERFLQQAQGPEHI